MSRVTHNDIAEAVDSLWSDHPSGHVRSLRTIESGFEQGIISADLARLVTNALLRTAMLGSLFNRDWPGESFRILQKATKPIQAGEVVVATTETLIALPEASELIDYWEAVAILSGLLKLDEQHPAFLKTLSSNASSREAPTDWCIVMALHRALSTGSPETDSGAYQLLGTVLNTGSDYAASEAAQLLRDLLKKDPALEVGLDQLGPFWRKLKDELLGPDWSSIAHMDDLTTNGVRLLGCLAARNEMVLERLPHPLDGLPVDINDRILHWLVSEISDGYLHKWTDGYASDSLEYAMALMRVRRVEASVYGRLRKAAREGE